jgi:hypothetical protein
MAQLTYTVFTGELVARSDDGKDVVFAMCESGFSNHWWNSSQKEKGKYGTPGHVPGGPIPTGRWRVHRPGSPHPDGGQLRSSWIPIGPFGVERSSICTQLALGLRGVSRSPETSSEYVLWFSEMAVAG